MPWCNSCDTFWDEADDPDIGAEPDAPVVADPGSPDPGSPGPDAQQRKSTVVMVCPNCGNQVQVRTKIPWHFKLMLVTLVVYLGYRFYQLIEWLPKHI